MIRPPTFVVLAVRGLGRDELGADRFPELATARPPRMRAILDLMRGAYRLLLLLATLFVWNAKARPSRLLRLPTVVVLTVRGLGGDEIRANRFAGPAMARPPQTRAILDAPRASYCLAAIRPLCLCGAG